MIRSTIQENRIKWLKRLKKKKKNRATQYETKFRKYMSVKIKNSERFKERPDRR